MSVFMQQISPFVCFEPVFHAGDTVLILGTMPSPASVRGGFYYAHRQNRFWKMLAVLQNAPVPATTPEKLLLLEQGHIALWDVLSSCNRSGAADSTIQMEKPNDIAGLLRRCGSIRKIACNGAKAYELYMTHIAQTLHEDFPVYKMPSTSPANAAVSFDALCEKWGVFFT